MEYNLCYVFIHCPVEPTEDKKQSLDHLINRSLRTLRGHIRRDMQGGSEQARLGGFGAGQLT
jgi:hypothetical protein